MKRVIQIGNGVFACILAAAHSACLVAFSNYMGSVSLDFIDFTPFLAFVSCFLWALKPTNDLVSRLSAMSTCLWLGVYLGSYGQYMVQVVIPGNLIEDEDLDSYGVYCLYIGVLSASVGILMCFADIVTNNKVNPDVDEENCSNEDDAKTENENQSIKEDASETVDEKVEDTAETSKEVKEEIATEHTKEETNKEEPVPSSEPAAVETNDEQGQDL